MKYIQIGVTRLETNDALPVYVDVDSVESAEEPKVAFVFDGLDSAFVLDNIMITHELEFPTQTAIQIANAYEADGALLTKKYLIILKDGEAQWISTVDMKTVEAVTPYNTDADFDEFDIEGIY